jgi:hypothetical protein
VSLASGFSDFLADHMADTETGWSLGTFGAIAEFTRVLRTTASMTLIIAFGLALARAYAAYEVVLFAATPVLGGAGDFTLAIVGRLAVLNVLWFLGLFVACEVARLLGGRRRSQVVS